MIIQNLTQVRILTVQDNNIKYYIIATFKFHNSFSCQNQLIFDKNCFPDATARGLAVPPSPFRRKISLPWFRQASLGERLTRLRLPRQHTLDCPPVQDHPDHQPSHWPKSATTYAERFRYSRKALSSSASVEVSCDSLAVKVMQLLNL